MGWINKLINVVGLYEVQLVVKMTWLVWTCALIIILLQQLKDVYILIREYLSCGFIISEHKHRRVN